MIYDLANPNVKISISAFVDANVRLAATTGPGPVSGGHWRLCSDEGRRKCRISQEGDVAEGILFVQGHEGATWIYDFTLFPETVGRFILRNHKPIRGNPEDLLTMTGVAEEVEEKLKITGINRRSLTLNNLRDDEEFNPFLCLRAAQLQ